MANDPVPPTGSIESSLAFTPRFGADGLIPAIVTDDAGDVLMFAHMNAEALNKTVATHQAHFWSRSRRKIWLKGEESGNLLKVIEIRTDCDQDVLWLKVEVEGAGVACHTGERSCFYRRVAGSTESIALEFAPIPHRTAK